MPAQAQHSVWTAFLSPTTDTVAVGYVMIPDADGDYYVIATSAARTAASRTTCCAGITLTAGDSNNRAVELQTVGPCPPEITGLGAGLAGDIIVSSTGTLERSASPAEDDVVCGKCDADGWAYLNFSARDGGGGGGTPAGDDGDLQVNDGGAFGAAASWTYPATGRLHAEHALMGTGASLITFAEVGASGDTITRADGSFVDEGFEAGQTIVVTGSVSNNVTAVIASVSALVLTLTDTDLVNEGPIGGVKITGPIGYITHGAVDATYPTEGLIRTDSTSQQKLITMAYNGGTYEVLSVTGAVTTIGSISPTDSTVHIYAGSAGAIQLQGGTVLLNWSSSYPSSDTFIDSSALIGSNLYLNWRDGSSDGLGAACGVFAIGKAIAAPSNTPDNSVWMWVTDPTTGGVKFKFPSGNTCVLPDASGTLLTSSSPSISSPVLTTPQINDTSSDHQYVFAVSELAADRTVTLPLLTAADEFVFKTHAVTLANKTLTSPVITSPTITGSNGASSAMGALAVDWAVANVFTKTLSAGGNTITFSNSADGQTIIVILTGAASTVTWPTVKWAAGAAPTQTASGIDVYTFVKAGSTIYGSVVQAMA